jgi:hypothetical protein
MDYMTNDISTTQVGRWTLHTATTANSVPLHLILEEIRNPTEQIKRLIEEIHNTYQAVGGGKAGKDAIRDLKGQLPCITFSATGTRCEPNAATGLVCIDLDELGGSLARARRDFESDPSVVMAFRSPSGDGLKVVLRVPVPQGSPLDMRKAHRRAFKAIRSYVRKHYELEVDPAASDLLRLCYLSHDPSCTAKFEGIEFDVDRHYPTDEDDADNRSDDPNAKDGCDPVAANLTEEVVEALLRSVPPRPDYQTWLRLSAAVRNSLGNNDRAVEMLTAWSPEEREGEYRELLESSSFSRIGYGTLLYQAKKHGFGGVISKFFYAGRAGYWMEVGGRFVPLPRESDLKQHLRLFGVDPKSPDCPSCRIRTEKLVQFVGEVAGHGAGLHTFNGDQFLVTKGPSIIASKPGGGEFVRDFAMQLLGAEEPAQYLNWLAWLHRIRKAVLKGQRIQIPALAVAGGAGDGKSLLIEIVCRSLGGRSANAYKFLSGQSRFNGDLVAAELLFIDDDAAAKDRGSRSRFAQFLKANLFAGSIAAEGKGANAIQCAPVQAVMIAVNSEPQHLRVLPELDDTMRDKIIILRSSPSPLPAELRGEPALIKERLNESLPGFLHEVDSLDPSEWISPTTGRLVCHWNQSILDALQDLSPENRLLELIDEEFGAAQGYEWTGTATQLESELTEANAKNAHASRQLLRWPAACGTFLSCLARNPQSPVQKEGLTVETRIQIYRIKRSRPEECEDPVNHFKMKTRKEMWR